MLRGAGKSTLIRALSGASARVMAASKTIVVDPFCMRQVSLSATVACMVPHHSTPRLDRLALVSHPLPRTTAPAMCADDSDWASAHMDVLLRPISNSLADSTASRSAQYKSLCELDRVSWFICAAPSRIDSDTLNSSIVPHSLGLPGRRACSLTGRRASHRLSTCRWMSLRPE